MPKPRPPIRRLTAGILLGAAMLAAGCLPSHLDYLINYPAPSDVSASPQPAP